MWAKSKKKKLWLLGLPTTGPFLDAAVIRAEDFEEAMEIAASNGMGRIIDGEKYVQYMKWLASENHCSIEDAKDYDDSFWTNEWGHIDVVGSKFIEISENEMKEYVRDGVPFYD